MPRTCTVCSHRDRDALERALLSGQSFRNIAKQFGTSSSALFRHRADHLPATLAKSHAAAEVVRSDSLMDEVRSGRDETEHLCKVADAIADKAFKEGNHPLALKAIHARVNLTRERRALTELRARISGELDPPKPSTPPNDPLNVYQMLKGGIHNNGPMMVIAMPKTPEAEAEERRRLIANGLLPDPNKLEAQNATPTLALPPPSSPAALGPSPATPLLPAPEPTPDGQQGDEEESDDLP